MGMPSIIKTYTQSIEFKGLSINDVHLEEACEISRNRTVEEREGLEVMDRALRIL